MLHHISRTGNMKRSGAYVEDFFGKQPKRKKKSIVICSIISIDDVMIGLFVCYFFCSPFFAFFRSHIGILGEGPNRQFTVRLKSSNKQEREGQN